MISLTHNCQGPGEEHGRPGDLRELEDGNQGEICSFDWQERKWDLEEVRYPKMLELRPALKLGTYERLALPVCHQHTQIQIHGYYGKLG